MNENNGPVQVKKEPNVLTGDVMVFSTFSVFFCGNILGWFGDATLTIGVAQVCLAGLFIICAYQRGYYASFWGNMNLIFSFYFGILGGVTNILMGAGVELNGLVLAVPNIIAGVVLFGTLPGARHDPWTFFILYLFAAIAVLGLGLGGVGIAPGFLYPLAAWCLLGVGILGTYAVIANVNACSGVNLPYGKPLFK